MKKFFILILLFFILKLNAQIFSGQVFMKENSAIYLNQVYVTNLSTQKTTLSNYNGEFKIIAKEGDVIRFTSIISERKDLTLTSKLLVSENNFIELTPAIHKIEEVVINFKPTGNLKTDVLALKKKKSQLEISKIVNLPEPKGDGLPPTLPVASFANGGMAFSIESIYDILSGERKKKERLNEYESMLTDIQNIKNYFGIEYFTKLKIPQNLIDNFLQFVYSSDNIKLYAKAKNFEATKPHIEKYLPIYMKRLRDSHLHQIAN